MDVRLTFIETLGNTRETPDAGTREEIPVEDLLGTIFDGPSRGLDHVWSRHVELSVRVNYRRMRGKRTGA